MIKPVLNHIQRMASQRFKQDFELTVFITNYCNEACEHCFYASELNTKQPELDAAAVRKLAASLPAHCRKVIFAGGEPFMRNDLIELISIFHQAGIREFSIVTNGTFTEKTLQLAAAVEALHGAKLTIQVSLDGPEDHHDRIRKHPGAHRMAMETLTALRELGVSTGVQAAVSRTNHGVIAEHDEEVYRRLGLDVHYQFVRGAEVSGLDPEMRNDFAPPDETLVASNAEIRQFLDTLRNVFLDRLRTRGRFLRRVYEYTALEAKYVIGVKQTNVFPCIAGKQRGVIYPTGDAAICEYLKPVRTKLQDVDHDFQALWETPEIRAQHRIAEDCHCTHGCFINIVATHRFFLMCLKNTVSFFWSSTVGRPSRKPTAATGAR